MSLERIGHFFDPLRSCQGVAQLHKLREMLTNIKKPATNDSTVIKNCLTSFLHDLLSDADLQFGLSDGQVHDILDQLNRSLEGSTDDNDIFMACWKYWLQDEITPKPALLIVDVQNDFITGTLALKNCPAGQDGYAVVPVINDILNRGLFDVIAYTLDWHPADHCSFIDNVALHPIHHTSPVKACEAKLFDTVVFANPTPVKQKLWPAHCIIDSWGAELHKDLKAPETKDIITKKGSNTNLDSYSAFWNNAHLTQTDLFEDLLARGVSDVYVCGLAMDYCVEFTALDAAQHGFTTHVIHDATAIISQEGCQNARDKFSRTGVKLINSSDIGEMLAKSS